MMDDHTELEEEVIFDGIRFMESLSRCYGAEQAVAVWERLGEALGTDIKHQVFFAMLTGETSDRMRVSRGTCTEAVAAIRAMRMATGMGLKEAKDLWDLTRVKTVTIDGVPRALRSEFVREIRSLGMRVH